MSNWTHIMGTINVGPLGRTQAEKKYILETVLSHLPLVTGAEDDMYVHIIQRNGTNITQFSDEFFMQTNNLYSEYGKHNRDRGRMKMQSEYILMVEGDLRDRITQETYSQFLKWLCRLAKRIYVYDILVHIYDDDGESKLIQETDKYNNPYHQMFEFPSWSFMNTTGESFK